nr:serine/threonine-protein phosphatase 6 regulatory ankyrin repeat subunit B-like [Aegilops tauschii subsp. strangulata]
MLLDHAMSPRCSTYGRDGDGAGAGGRASVFRLEMMSRAVHAAARGGSVRMLKELIDGRSDVSAYLDIRGSTVLHAAAGRGQLEVVKRYVPLHSAIAGFRTPGFRRLDRQLELTKHLIRERAADIRKIINLRNDAGLTALHMAVVGCVHPDLVELLMTTPSIDLNVEDADGMTPLALLKEQLRSTTSERLIKQIVSAGGVLSSSVLRSRSAVVSQIKMRGGIAISPGTMFRISDAEILLHSGIAATESRRASSCSSDGKCDPTGFDKI